ncbi:MAG: amidohydrolase family protein [Candidatus Liptonbacteria bacterium]|nr:amidohydrolase family protein [Candidatus Liptonbacteria bacterium]
MTLLIKNVQVLGSAQKLPERIDIFISGDKISAFGNFPTRGADEVIEGQGAYVSPGFIDVNTDSDHYLTLFDDPGQEDFLKQGVTTIIGGHCGSSLAPLLYGTLESIRKWADIDHANVNWNTMKELLDVLEKRPLGVNFATLVGHSTIRRALIGETFRNLTKNELGVLGETVKRALIEGGLGFSTGLGYTHGRATPYHEIKFLAEIVKNYGGVYATHLRKDGLELNESVDETLKILKEAGVKTLISHFAPHFGEEKEYEKALEKFDMLPPDADFHFDLYPYGATAAPLYTFLPVWAQNGNLETMNAALEDEWRRSKIIKEFPELREEDFVVAQAPKNEALVGLSLKKIKELYGTSDAKETLSKLMLSTKLRAVIFYKNINQDMLEKALRHPRSLIASNAASFSDGAKEKVIIPEHATSTFTKFLSLVEQSNLMPLEEAIRKITLEPAKKFGLKNRGEIKEGNFADLVGFSSPSQGYGRTGVSGARPAPPADRRADSYGKNIDIKFVVVNGRIALKDGGSKNMFFGKILRNGRQ